MTNKIRAIGAAVLVVLWAALTGFAWFGPAREISEAERRKLDQMPELTIDSLWEGKFMGDFEDYTLDQFPLRDTFRTLKALFHYNALQQMDNNGIYVADGFAAKVEYPYHQESVDHATKRFHDYYNRFLKDSGSKIYMAVVPDKGYYLAEKNGYPAMDYGALFDTVEKVFSQEEKLRSVGLTVPRVTQILKRLQNAGIPIDANAFTVQDAVQRVVDLLQRGSEHA